MAKQRKVVKPKARLPKGMRDITASELGAIRTVQARVREIYELYGFSALETPAFEYSDALGKFLPDQDRPNAGVFSFEDEDGQWVSLRYDLTAPLARYVAENYDSLPKPFRRYQTGDVWRNEKPGPGRFRQFVQFDADTVGTSNIAADAEICMLAADTLEHLGIARGDYRIRVNSRKVLDGILETAGVDPFGDENVAVRLTVLRAVDKLDRLGTDGVEQLLGKGRKDESGDFTPGAGLSPDQISALMRFVEAAARSLAGQSSGEALSALGALVGDSACGREGLADLEKLSSLVEAAGFGADRIVIDPAIVRGLDYYTGPVFEAELTFEHRDEDGILTRFGSVGGGGRYDGLVARFKGAEVPATGFSIGVSRLVSALLAIDSDVLKTDQLRGPVVVLALGDDGQLVAQEMVQELRSAGIRAEPYLGTAGMKAQLKYADRRGAAVAVIAGEDERAAGQVTLKDLDEGARLSAEIADNTEWRSGKPAQTSVARGDLVAGVRAILADSAKG